MHAAPYGDTLENRIDLQQFAIMAVFPRTLNNKFGKTF